MSSASELVNKYFNAPSSDCYWHFMAKNKSKEALYKHSKLSERIEAFKKADPENTFDKKVQGLTALHVAVLKENKAAAVFLKSMGAALDAKDPFGKSAIDYASKEMRAILLAETAAKTLASAPSEELKLTFDPVFQKYRVPLKHSALYKKNTNDFGLIIKKLRCLKPCVAETQEHTPFDGVNKAAANFIHGAQNLQSVAKELGITLNFSGSKYHVRDHLIHSGKGEIITFVNSESIPLALDRTLCRSLYLMNYPMFLTNHDHFMATPGSSIGLLENAFKDIEATYGEVLSSRFYFEGGNLYKVTHPTDPRRTKIFIGEFSFIMALNQLRIDKVFDELGAGVSMRAKQLQELLPFEEIKNGMREMYAQGLLKIDGKDGFIKQMPKVIGAGKEMVGDRKGNPFLHLAQSFEKIEPFNPTEAQVKKAAPLVFKYLAQKDILKEMIGKTFGALSEDVHIIVQADFHLDCFMRPGPKGSMFLQDYGFSAELLEYTSKNADAFGLTAKDKTILNRYIQTATKLHKELSPLYSQAKAEIEKAGYTVIPMPGIFNDLDKEDLRRTSSYHLNFINALTGWSEKKKSFYYIAAGAQVGDQLGRVLMKSFEQFLNQYEKIQLCYIGGDSEKPGNFQEAMSWWNTSFQSGPHCMTFEEETESFKQ